MAALSEATWEKVRALFPPTQQDEVAAKLQNQCGNNLPFLGKETPEGQLQTNVLSQAAPNKFSSPDKT